MRNFITSRRRKWIYSDRVDTREGLRTCTYKKGDRCMGGIELK
jgi:hypothetical protein